MPPGYAKELGYEWGSPFRFERIVEQLAGGGQTPGSKFTVESFQRLQQDVVSLPARRMIRLLAAAKGAPEELRPWAERLTRWDGSLGPRFVRGRSL